MAEKLRCQACQRSPAKFMTFKAHQGFVIFRKTYTISGVFCRDCALEAYAQARGISFRGMWFGVLSLTFGTIRSVWDTVQLVDLPPEIKDDLGVVHKAKCFHCHKPQYVYAGPQVCAYCKNRFIVGSCKRCRKVQSLDYASVNKLNLRCADCHLNTNGEEVIRNWPDLPLHKREPEPWHTTVSQTAIAIAGPAQESPASKYTPTAQKLHKPNRIALVGWVAFVTLAIIGIGAIGWMMFAGSQRVFNPPELSRAYQEEMQQTQQPAPASVVSQPAVKENYGGASEKTSKPVIDTLEYNPPSTHLSPVPRRSEDQLLTILQCIAHGKQEMEGNNFRAAISDFSNAIYFGTNAGSFESTKKWVVLAYVLRSKAYGSLNDERQARADLNAALALDPSLLQGNDRPFHYRSPPTSLGGR